MNYKIKKLSKVKGGKRLPKGKMLTSDVTNHPYIKVRDMLFGRVEITPAFEYVPEEIFPSIKQYTVKSNDVILSIVGTIGNVSIVGKSLNGASLTENCVKFTDLNLIIPEYLFYFLSSSTGQERIKHGIVGAVQPKLPIYNIEDIEVDVPPIEVQQHIVNTSSTLVPISL